MVIHTRLLAGRVSALLAATLLAGCVTQPEPLYRWGEYENLIYTMYMQMFV